MNWLNGHWLPKDLAMWIKVHDRVEAGEMPPKNVPEESRTPESTTGQATDKVEQQYSRTLFWNRRSRSPRGRSRWFELDRQELATTGRAVWRRMNRYEYEIASAICSMRFAATRIILPEDGELNRFNKMAKHSMCPTSILHATCKLLTMRNAQVTAKHLRKNRQSAASAPQQSSFNRKVHYTN